VRTNGNTCWFHENTLTHPSTQHHWAKPSGAGAEQFKELFKRSPCAQATSQPTTHPTERGEASSPHVTTLPCAGCHRE
jgi:hypothetical protein